MTFIIDDNINLNYLNALSIFSKEDIEAANKAADHWYTEIGPNVIPADTKRKEAYILKTWKQYQSSSVPLEVFERWKALGLFAYGIAVVTGVIWRGKNKNLCLNLIDGDNRLALEELCTYKGKTVSLQQFASWTLVEQHKDDPNRGHVYILSTKPFPIKASDKGTPEGKNKVISNIIPGIEVKNIGGLSFAWNSVHEGGYRYEFVNGSENPALCDDFASHIDGICRRYSLQYLDENGNGVGDIPIQELFKADTIIYEGNNRHKQLLRICDSLIARLQSIYPQEKIKSLAMEYNKGGNLQPALDDREFEKIWKQSLGFIARDEENQEQPTESKQEKTQAQILIEIVDEKSELLFQDQYGAPCVKIAVGDHEEVMFIQNSKFKHYLSKLFFDDNHGKVVGQEVLNDVVRTLTARALYEGPVMELNLRVAWAKRNEEIHYDLTDQQWSCIRITKDEWSISAHDTNTMFTRFNQKPQVEPDRDYPDNILDKFLDMMYIHDPEQRILNKVWIISVFIPEFPHPIEILHGEKGSLKSTLCRYKKRLVDPDKIELLTIPKDKAEFVQQLYHNYLGVYENVRYLPPWFSDEACRAITGAGNSKRGLYTNDEDVIYNYKRCLMVNGINNVLTESDALDRCILSEYERLTPEQRREESAVDNEFEQMRAQLLGFIFDTLVIVLAIKPTVKLTDLPRMADFAAWGETIARALGYKNLAFIDAYYDNIGKQNVEAIENNLLGQAMEKFVDSWFKEDSQACWQSPMSILLERLNEIAQQNNIDVEGKGWPKAPHWLTRRLTPILSNLREGLGIDVSIKRTTMGDKGRKNTSSIRVRKVAPLPPLDQNQARNEGESSGAIFDSGANSSTTGKYLHQKTDQNRAQNPESGASGASGAIFGTLGGTPTEPSMPCHYCNQSFKTTEITSHMDKCAADAIAEYERKRTEGL